ncbi:DNA-directed RNA polymerase subunit delta [[Mycoplasma] anseris]|uniref:Uncharacterized protein n=1 Tax=[Mycoplasma] anseris TaxID=92400 RepID=A0A2Z4NCK6_9BACT|nr:hypothetical protein [[Mycoplasma] anseris]AWX69293.1 hypothetical protein DP065_00785 [[Mycoplasma] anseris]
MEARTMADVAESILNSHGKADFAKLFDETAKILFSKWRKETIESISDEKMLEIKRGELYKLLTIDGRFFRNENGTWTTIRPDID